jgi:hypothetical protein
MQWGYFAVGRVAALGVDKHRESKIKGIVGWGIWSNIILLPRKRFDKGDFKGDHIVIFLHSTD